MLKKNEDLFSKKSNIKKHYKKGCYLYSKLVLLEKQNLPLLDKGICAPMPFFIVHKIRNPQSIVRKITKMLKTFERLLIIIQLALIGYDNYK